MQKEKKQFQKIVPELGIDPLKDNIKFIVASSDDPGAK